MVLLALLSLLLLLWITRDSSIARWRGLLWTGAICLFLAAWGMEFPLHPVGKVVVMIDVSNSTRTAAYHDPDYSQKLIGRLLGTSPYEVRYFADGIVAQSSLINTSRTTFSPPSDADAILLFSDGQFALPASSPPVFAVLDPELAQAGDARVGDVSEKSGQATVTIVNDGPARQLQAGRASRIVGPGVQTVTLPLAGGTADLTINPADAWPENDRVRVVRERDDTLERWSIGRPAPGWTSIDPATLAQRQDELVRVGVISVEPTLLPDAAAQTLVRYVHELGGTLILQGDPGLFPPALRQINALSDVPPLAASRWVILLDASGSMATDNRWPSAVQAAREALSAIPDNAPLSVAAFNDQLRLIVPAGPASKVRDDVIPFNTIAPGGPTRLQPALEALARDPSDLPTRILLLSDGDAEIVGADALIEQLQSRHIQVYLAATAPLPGLSLVRRVCEQSGGAVIESGAASEWGKSMSDLARQARADRGHRAPATVQYANDLAALPRRTVEPWFSAWRRSESVALTQDDPLHPLAARRAVGLGRVAGFAFSLEPAELDAVAMRLESQVHDPRFAVHWEDRQGSVRVEIASDLAANLGASLHCRLVWGDRVTEQPLAQTGPGIYEAHWDRPEQPTSAVLTWQDHVLARHAIPGRAAPEFDAIGLNRPRLEQLARQSGGATIDPRSPGWIHWPRRTVPLDLTRYFAAVGAALVGLWMVLDRAPYLLDRWQKWLHLLRGN